MCFRQLCLNPVFCPHSPSLWALSSNGHYKAGVLVGWVLRLHDNAFFIPSEHCVPLPLSSGEGEGGVSGLSLPDSLFLSTLTLLESQ